MYFNRYLSGYTNILVYASQIRSGCYIRGYGSSEADAIVTVDFGQTECTSGVSITLDEGSIIFDGREVIRFDSPFKDIILKMTECNDEINILKTFTDVSSINVLAYGGNDKIVLGDETESLDTIIFGNIMIDGGRGSADILWIHNEMSVAGFNTVGADTIIYFATENIDVKISDNRYNDTNAAMVVDFGQGPCTSGNVVSLRDGSIFIAGEEFLQVGTNYKEFIFEMTDCDDEVDIMKTYTDTSLVKILGFNGNDRIYLGDESKPFHTVIFSNIIVDGGHGSADLLTIHDEASSTTKPIEVDLVKIVGFHGNKTIFYSSININMLVGTADAQVNVNSTAAHTSLTLITQGTNNSLTRVLLILLLFFSLSLLYICNAQMEVI